MSGTPNVQHIHDARILTRTVFFTGSTALKRGMALCYDRDHTHATDTPAQTATDEYGGRDMRVELPTITNNNEFAGTVLDDAPARTGGQFVEIAEPGGFGPIRVLEETVVATTRLTFICGGPAAGYFAQQGFDGRGTAKAMQTTVTASATIADNPNGPIVQSWTGSGSCTTAGVITDTGKGTNVAAGDKVIVFGGRADNTDTDTVTAGEYTVSSSADADTITLSSSPVSGETSYITYVVYRGEPVVQAQLLDGVESGGIQYIESKAGTESDDPMVGGWTFCLGGYDINSSSHEGQLDDAFFDGQLKGIKMLGAIDDADVEITLETAGLQRGVLASGPSVDSTDAFGEQLALASFSFDGANDTIILQNWGVWQELYATSGIVKYAA
jgi:hypothetical protein